MTEKLFSEMSVEEFNQTVKEMIKVFNENVVYYGSPTPVLHPLTQKYLELGKKKFRGYKRFYRKYIAPTLA